MGDSSKVGVGRKGDQQPDSSIMIKLQNVQYVSFYLYGCTEALMSVSRHSCLEVILALTHLVTHSLTHSLKIHDQQLFHKLNGTVLPKVRTEKKNIELTA